MRNLRSHPTQRRDHYQELTDRIIAALEAGTSRRGADRGTRHACGGSDMPVNVATGHRYRGINLLSCSACRRSPSRAAIRAGASYRQADGSEDGRSARARAATTGYFYKPIEIREDTKRRTM